MTIVTLAGILEDPGIDIIMIQEKRNVRDKEIVQKTVIVIKEGIRTDIILIIEIVLMNATGLCLMK